MSKDEIWKVINVDVEPRQKSFRIGITPETTVEEVIKTLVNKCKEENIELDKWAKAKVGQENAEFVLIRKSTEELIPPTVSSVSYTHLRAHETRHDLVCRLLLEKKKRGTEYL